MSRFSPAYRRQKPFTLFEGVQNAAGALLGYEEFKHQRGRQGEQDERARAAETRAGELHGARMDDYRQYDERWEEDRDYGRERDRVKDYYDFGIIRGEEERPAPGETGGIPNVQGMPTIEGEGAPIGTSNDLLYRGGPEVGPPGSDLKRVGSGIRGDWNSIFLQADGAMPIPGTRYFAMPRSGKMEQEAQQLDELARMLEASPERTGFAADPRNEAEIQARTGALKPGAAATSLSGGRMTPYQDQQIAENEANFVYLQALQRGASQTEAIAEARSQTGVLPDYGQAMDAPSDLSGPLDRVTRQYGPAPPGIAGVVAEMLAMGETPNAIMQALTEHEEGGIGGDVFARPARPSRASPAQADTARSYLSGDYRSRARPEDAWRDLIDEELRPAPTTYRNRQR